VGASMADEASPTSPGGKVPEKDSASPRAD
jgi:hypothetical protein